LIKPETLSAYRVFPRVFSVFYLYLMGTVSFWFMGIAEPSAEQTAFASMMATTAAAWFKFYISEGK